MKEEEQKKDSIQENNGMQTFPDDEAVRWKGLMQKLHFALGNYLPYGVNVHIDGCRGGVLTGIEGDRVSTPHGFNYPLRSCKPCLRPLSSMTEEEKSIFNTYVTRIDTPADWGIPPLECLLFGQMEHLLRWLNENKFDWLGLIPDGLATEAPEGMYGTHPPQFSCGRAKFDWTTSTFGKEGDGGCPTGEIKFVDLGLPSGTLWADSNICNPDNRNGFWTWDDIMASPYKNNVPTKEQMDELRECCKWKWDKDKGGFNVVGRNGNGIFLPAEGYRSSDKYTIYGVGYYGNYWTSTCYDGKKDVAYDLCFDKGILCNGHCANVSLGFSVRPVRQR